MATKKLKCFVAMAFGKADTDQLYENCIKKTLQKNNITPIIINRRQNNDDLNNQIIDQLEKADFCIADLTYARPSVYFEAGYAQRKVEVVYTVRKDHLERNKPDNEQVHFDLKMKPLLLWSKSNQIIFCRNLEKRLRATVIRDFFIKTRLNKKRLIAERKFAAISVNDRLHEIRRNALSVLKGSTEFKEWHTHSPFRRFAPDPLLVYRETLTQRTWHDLRFFSELRTKTGFKAVAFRATEKISLADLRKYESHFIMSDYAPYLDTIRNSTREGKYNYELRYCFLTLQNIPAAKVMSAMPCLRWNSALNIYFCTRRFERHHAIINVHVNLKFISNIKSIDYLRTELKPIMVNKLLTSDNEMSNKS